MAREILEPGRVNPDQHYFSRKKQWYALPEGVKILLTPRQLGTLDLVIKAGEQGIYRNTLAQGNMGEGMDPDMASASVGNSIKQVNRILSKTARAGRIISEIVKEKDRDVKKGRPALIHTYKPHKPLNPDDSSEAPQVQLESEPPLLKTRNAESKIKNTEQIIGAYSVFQVLLNLAQGTLDKIPQDVEEHLSKTLKTALEKKIIESNIIKGLSNVFISPSKEHLERFFRVNFLAYLESWEIKAEEAKTKEDKDFAQIFKRLKDQQYTKEQVTKEVLVDHFGLKIQPSQVVNTQSL